MKIPVLLSLSNLTLLLTYLFWSAYFSHTAFVFCLFFLLSTPFSYTAYYFSLFLCISLCLGLFLPAIHLSSVFLFLLFGPPLFIVCACSFSCVQFFVTLWTVTRQAPLSVGFSKQESWSGLPFPFPGDLPDSGIKDPCISCIDGWILYHSTT